MLLNSDITAAEAIGILRLSSKGSGKISISIAKKAPVAEIYNGIGV